MTRNDKFNQATVLDGVITPRTPAERRAAALNMASIALRLSTRPAEDLREILDALGLRPL